MAQDGPMSAPAGDTFLLRGGLLVTLDGMLGEFTGDVLVAGGTIRAVARRIDAGDREIVDASECVILPGFVDPHRHAWQSPIRLTGTDWDLPRMFVELFRRFGPNMRPEDVYAATLFGRLAALDAGVTTMLDWAHIQNSPEHADAAIRALREVEGRTVYAHGQPGVEPERWMRDSTLPHPADIRRLRERVLTSDDALVTLAMAARGPEFTTIETVEHDLRLARELGLRTTIHIGLGANGPKYRGIERMHARGLLGPDLTFVHCCNSSDHEFCLMAETGATASVSAQIAAMCGGFGLPATGRLLAHGIRPSLSVDSEMSVSGDMFAEMRAALGIERAIVLNRLQERPRAVSITARDVLQFATIEGARAVGLADRIGSITPGKSADLLLLPRSALNLAPLADPINALVLGGHAGNVEGVLVAGRAVKWNGRLTGADAGRAIGLLEQSREYLYARAEAIGPEQVATPTTPCSRSRHPRRAPRAWPRRSAGGCGRRTRNRWRR
jgi:cytosine/adenosine deaminase-related metal-dependent hydrolase